MTSSLLGGIQTPPLPLVIMSWLNDVITFGGYPDPPLPLKWWRHLWTAPKWASFTSKDLKKVDDWWLAKEETHNADLATTYKELFYDNFDDR